MTPEQLAAIEARARDYDDRTLPACPHGREPVDRCDVCTGDDARALIAEVRRLTAELEQARLIADERDSLWAVARDASGARDALVAEVRRLRKLFDDAGKGEHNVLALVEHYQREAIDTEEQARRLTDERDVARALAEDPVARLEGIGLVVLDAEESKAYLERFETPTPPSDTVAVPRALLQTAVVYLVEGGRAGTADKLRALLRGER